MKSKTLILAILLYSIVWSGLNAQIRENKEILKFNLKSSKLTNAKGWEQNKETGKWVANKNVIEDRKCPSYWVSHVTQNFKWIQFATISNNGQEYYVLLFERLGGEYKYPNTQQEWENDKRTYYFIITPTQFKEIKDEIDLISGTNIKISSNMTGFITNRFKLLGGEYLYNEENLLAKITKSIERPSSTDDVCFIFNSQVIDNHEVVRFRLPESCYFSEENMKGKYFEAKAKDFKKILFR